MLKRLICLVLGAATVAGIVGACGGSSSPKTPTAVPTAVAAATDLVAKKQAPASLAGDDPAWKDARVTTVKTSQIKGSASVAPVDVKMQALYSDTDVWFRFEWADSTETIVRYWDFDGSKFKLATGQQDRLSLFWQITPVADFQAKGCAALCHNPETDTIDKWYMIAPKTGDLMDNWQWTAGVSNGMNQANDLSLTPVLTSPTALGSPFVADPGTGGNTANANAANDGPAQMQDPAKKPSLGPNYLLVTEAVALDVSKLKAGDKVPRDLMAPWVGDRGDIDAKGVWANGSWTVVFHRKLNTGNADDAQLTVGKSYPFGLAVFNALGNVDHTVTTDVYTLVLK
jgi:ethylbenzene dehydrogenase